MSDTKLNAVSAANGRHRTVITTHARIRKSPFLDGPSLCVRYHTLSSAELMPSFCTVNP
jgi:hypothetical protein